MPNINSITHSINFSNPTWDAFIILFWIIASVIYSFSSGRGRIISILMSTYMAELLVIQAPFLSTTLSSRFGVVLYLARVITFGVLFAFFFFVLSRFVFRTSIEMRGMISWVFSIIFAFLQVGFLISVVVSFLPSATKDTFAPIVRTLFVTPNAQFIWLVLPIAFLIIFGRFISDHHRLD